MSSQARFLLRLRSRTLFAPAIGGVCAAIFATPLLAQHGTPLGLPQDWSHRHVIHSNPETLDEAVSSGKVEHWLKKANDPRFVLQLEKKQERQRRSLVGPRRGAAESDGESEDAGAAATVTKAAVANAKRKKPPAGPSGPEIHRDWSNVMGGASGKGATRTYPAKFSFTTATKSCPDDFVVFTTSTAGAAGSGTVNSRPGTFSGVPAAGQTVTITSVPYVPDQVLTLTADASDDTGLKFAVGANATEAATNLANAIARNGGTIGVTATSLGAVVTVTSVTTAVTNANLTSAETLDNFTWGTQTAGTGTPGQPTIFALNQLYADIVANEGCQNATQAVPAVYWSYNTGTGAVADLSPVLSFYDNGAQVAFMQRSGGVSSLVLLKWSSSSPGTIGAPTAPASVTPANYRSCTAPCMTVMPLSGNPDNTNSSPYVDYSGDTIYVGDDTGKLHKFTGVFQSDPAEAASPWPVTVSTGSILSSPVFDGNLVWVGSNGPGTGGLDGNRLHSVNASGTVDSAGAMGSSSNVNGVRDGPIVDTTAGKVYAFIGATSNTPTDIVGTACTDPNCQAVFQFNTTGALALQNGGLGAKVFLGQGGNQNDLTRAISAGDFDDAYYSSGGTGSLYVCGGQPDVPRRPTLYKVAITAGAFTARTRGPQLSDQNGTDMCSPVTLVKNNTAEYLFASVTNGGSAAGGGGCTTPLGGCMYMYSLVPPSPGTVFDTTSLSSTINSAAARFINVSASALLSTKESDVDTLTAAKAGTYSAMTITQSVASPAGNTFTYTLRKNATSTTLTCQITEFLSTCSDTTHLVGFVTTDQIDVQVVRTAGAANLTATFQVELTADVTWNDTTSATAAINASGGSGGIIIDNTATGGGSQIYYSTRSAGALPGIAVQASQAGLN